MSRDLNRLELLGRLGQAPELRHTAAGKTVTTMSLATNNQFTAADGSRVDDVSWHRVVVWGKAAEVCAQYLRKGSRCMVIGRLQYRKWEDRETGVERVSAEVVAAEVLFLDAARLPAAVDEELEPAF